MSDADLLDRVADDLTRLGFIDGPADVLAREVLRQRYAYVIYDLNHRANVETVRQYCEKQLGIALHGRFGEFSASTWTPRSNGRCNNARPLPQAWKYE